MFLLDVGGFFLNKFESIILHYKKEKLANKNSSKS